MTTYIVPIEAWVEIEANSAEQAWQVAVDGLAREIGDAIEVVGERSGVVFCEPEPVLDEEND